MEAEESLKDDDDEGEESEEMMPAYMEYWYRSNYVDAVEAFKVSGTSVLSPAVLLQLKYMCDISGLVPEEVKCRRVILWPHSLEH